MKLITWNCNMAFRKKVEKILIYQPDVLVIPECEHPSKLGIDNWSFKPAGVHWQGNNLNKGLGIFSFNGIKLKPLGYHNEAFRIIVPVRLTGFQKAFTLYAVWANNPKDADGAYITQVWKALNHYGSLIKTNNTIMMGDFNSNTIWDKPRRVGNHSTVVNWLARKKIHSVYHFHNNCNQGKEPDPTLFMYRHRDKPYHLDYCFMSNNLLKHLSSVEVGSYKDWCAYSDHTPLIASLNHDYLKRTQ